MSYKINVIEYFEESYKKYPQRIAVKEENKSISFEELHSRVLSYANYIKKTLGAKKSIIAVLLPKGIDSVIADLAILYSGNAYMNLDVKNPENRLNAILEQVNPNCVLTNNSIKKTLNQNVKVVNCFGENSFIQKNEEVDISFFNDLIDTDPLCVINTSGSTGTPKAVILNHRSFIDFIEAVRYEKLISDGEIIASLSPIVFDIYSFELCMLMCWGATICVVPEMFSAFPTKLVQFLQEEQISYIFWVPTIMVNIANLKLLDFFSLKKLRMIWFAGEVFPTAKFNYWRSKLEKCRFVNFYGPIEITLDCLFYEIKEKLDDNSPIPIGKPFRNTSVIVLDDNNKLVKDGEEGELCIRGSSLAMGYFGNKEKTKNAFVQNPLNSKYPEIVYRTGDIVSRNGDGNFVFRGRKDTLIKRMGYRIELTEIEHVVVSNLKIVKNCCVLYDSQSKDIILVYESDNQLDERIIQKQIMSVLPKYMVPTKYIHSYLLPRNTNGKIDRNALKNSLIGE